MSDLYINSIALGHLFDLLQPPPSITEWQRLESEPAELDLKAGLEAQIADPLWLVGRQWQFTELRGEDAGMPVQVNLSGSTGRLTLPGAPTDTDLLPEPVIEAEAARSAIAAIGLEAGIDLAELLAAHGAKTAYPAFLDAFGQKLTPRSDDPVGRDLALIHGPSALDAVGLASALEGLRGGDGTITTLPGVINLPQAQQAKALAAAIQWLEDWNDLLVEPAAPGRWRADRLEYAFPMAAATSEGIVPLDVPEYAHGQFDWWAIDVAGPAAGAAQTKTIEAIRVPVPIRFAGMAADRLFEIEEGAVNLLATSAGQTSFVTMLLLEYMVASSNDWYQLPFTLDYGSCFQVGRLAVTDSFGVETLIGPTDADTGWTMFRSTAPRRGTADHSLFLLPSAAAHVLEGEPIEEVALFRDEMANLAWAVERKLPGLTATALPATRGPPAPQSFADLKPTDASLIYRLQTPVPPNWFPLSAEPDSAGPPGAIGFKLRAVRRAGDAAGDEARPKGVILAEAGLVAKLIDEREIPRSGIVVTRSFQCARDSAGRRLVWLGRRKSSGRGEGSSGFRFDQLDAVPDGVS